LLHEAFSAGSRAPISVLTEERLENIFLNRCISADVAPGAVELVDVSGEEPGFHFLDGGAADELGPMHRFEIGKEIGPSSMLAIAVR
jgi:hypothetical protein